ncbi:Chloramphenicol acetyltransferase-like domain protein [Akanthomyces lecanii RCEF 1005]|uniref:Chloramphenicol acetyltransferase-like domain protein n=1 Tax=Akanthomyces lecanii RCEF 1005 TaxID=1081108 RepID=A0A168GWD7_CORDF|nr:Chloramphenicol acetyltransferase-like domain protein [Akanthomyces lecanii RCEF 1005]
MSGEAPTLSRPLTAWNQAALRGYIRQVHCFETDGGCEALEVLRGKLRQALKHVCLRMPYMAGKLSLSKEQPGVILLHTREDDQVRLMASDVRGNKNLVYAKLRDRGFSASAFVGSVFNTDHTLCEDGPPIPVSQILLLLVDGGILMCVFVYHSITDGVGVNYFLSAVAAALKDQDTFLQKPLGYPSRIDIPVPPSSSKEKKDAGVAKVLSKQCPELSLAETGTNHEDYMTSMFGVSKVKFGGIFVFGPEKLRLVKDAVVSAGYSRMPSTFACLTVLSWAFMTTTRLRTVGIAEKSRKDNTQCRIVIPTWWGDRLFHEQLRDYAGNAVAFTETWHGAADLFVVAESASTDLSHAKGALMRLVNKIEATLGSVDEAFIKTRSTLFNNVADPRQLQYSFTPSDPKQLFFNSWRRLGADIEWTIPTAAGLKSMTADAIRKSQSEWNESAGLIMPGRRDKLEYEAVLSSDADSMESLRKNKAWKSWIDREIF